jgi:hypothetical protein
MHHYRLFGRAALFCPLQNAAPALCPIPGLLLWPGVAAAQTETTPVVQPVTLSAPGLVDTAGIQGADTAWLMVSTALVLLMTLPGIALFYGGMVRRFNIINTMAAWSASPRWSACSGSGWRTPWRSRRAERWALSSVASSAWALPAWISSAPADRSR